MKTEFDAVADRILDAATITPISQATADRLEPLPRLLVDAKDAAATMGIARSSFLAKLESGTIPLEAIRLGGRVLFSTAEIRAWIASGCLPGSQWRERWATIRGKIN